MEEKMYECLCCGKIVPDKEASGVLINTQTEYGRTGERSIDLITSIIWCKVSNEKAPVHICYRCVDKIIGAPRYKIRED